MEIRTSAVKIMTIRRTEATSVKAILRACFLILLVTVFSLVWAEAGELEDHAYRLGVEAAKSAQSNPAKAEDIISARYREAMALTPDEAMRPRLKEAFQRGYKETLTRIEHAPLKDVFQKGRIYNITATRNVAWSQPVGPSDVFTPDTNPIYVWFRHEGFSDGATITAVWYFLGTPTPYKIGEGTVTLTQPSDWGQFNYELAAGKKWPLGDYRVELQVAGTPVGETRFRVAETPIPASWKVFQEKGFGYSIRYPADWIYTKSSSFTVVFSGKEGTDAYYSTMSIQNIASTKIGGKYENIDSVIDNLKVQFGTSSQNVRIYDEKVFIYTTMDGIRLSGKEFKAEYTRQGGDFRQWVIVVPRSAGDIFHIWLYTSPVNQYNTYLKTAEVMLRSWEIGEPTPTEDKPKSILEKPYHAPRIEGGWNTNAVDKRGKNGQQFTYLCPANGSPHTVWGTDVYTDDSSICTAAVHIRLITFQTGGAVTIEIKAGQSNYMGSNRNSVSTKGYGSWHGSFIFVGPTPLPLKETPSD